MILPWFWLFQPGDPQREAHQELPSLASIVHGLWKTAADAGAVEAAVRDMAKEPENTKEPRRWMGRGISCRFFFWQWMGL